MLSCPFPPLYRHRFSHREKWPAFQLGRLQMRYNLKKQKYRKLQSLIVSCSCSKQAVGRYPSFHMLGKYKGTLLRSSSFWILRQDQVAVPGCAGHPSCPWFCSAGGCGVLRGGFPAQMVECVLSHPVLYIVILLICLLFIRQTEKASWFASLVS